MQDQDMDDIPPSHSTTSPSAQHTRPSSPPPPPPPPSSSQSPPTSKINVLVFAGAGVSQSSLLHLQSSIKALLSPRYDVLTVTPESLIKDPWTDNCALLAFPGGRDLGYLTSLGPLGCRRIREWVERDSGRYLGVCAGAYFASESIEFERGRQGFEVVGERPLKFFPGYCNGTAFPGFVYDSEDGARDAIVQLEGHAWRDVQWIERPETVDVYYNGGGYFEEPAESLMRGDSEGVPPRVAVLARYAELPGKPPAGVLCRVGTSGKAVLWGVHPEHPSTTATVAGTSAGAGPAEPNKEVRMALLRATLELLDLEVPQDKRIITGPTPLLLTSLEPAEAGALAEAILARFPKRSIPGPDASAPTILADHHDSFRVWSQNHLTQVFSQPRSTAAEDQNKLDLVVCSHGSPPSSATPIFDISIYFRHLAQSRKRLQFRFKPSFGSELLYGEVVTSTQTVLEKNPSLLSALPSGFVFVGSHQIAGRGRGSNNWLSPPGCLQFSLVLRTPKHLGPKLVFAQYLFGLSVVEAVRSLPGYGDLGLRLKWPNDLYADMGQEQGLKKIGGILVNSFFAGGDFTVIIGCGINTTNSSPTTSLLHLIHQHNATTGQRLAVITQEQLLALILARFEAFWAQFESEQSFSSFAPLYTARWLHSDKEVGIQETGQRVKIVGLTPDQGLLRTVNLDHPGPLPEFIDLQPDGNSFDMMQGLLKAKR